MSNYSLDILDKLQKFLGELKLHPDALFQGSENVITLQKQSTFLEEEYKKLLKDFNRISQQNADSSKSLQEPLEELKLHPDSSPQGPKNDIALQKQNTSLVSNNFNPISQQNPTVKIKQPTSAQQEPQQASESVPVSAPFKDTTLYGDAPTPHGDGNNPNPTTVEAAQRQARIEAEEQAMEAMMRSMFNEEDTSNYRYDAEIREETRITQEQAREAEEQRIAKEKKKTKQEIDVLSAQIKKIEDKGQYPKEKTWYNKLFSTCCTNRKIDDDSSTLNESLRKRSALEELIQVQNKIEEANDKLEVLQKTKVVLYEQVKYQNGEEKKSTPQDLIQVQNKITAAIIQQQKDNYNTPTKDKYSEGSHDKSLFPQIILKLIAIINSSARSCLY